MRATRSTLQASRDESLRVFIDSYGCAFNKSDSQAICTVLKNAGFELTCFEKADAVVLNSCAVKNNTENRMFSRIAKYAASGKKVVVTGCLPRVNSRRLRKAKVAVVDSDSIMLLPEALTSGEPLWFLSSKRVNKLRLLEDSKEPVIVPIAEGCTSLCAYCCVKNARGALASYSPGELVCFVRKQVEAGKKRFLLTAQDTGCYGLDRGTNLAELLEKIVAVDGVFQVRVGMMNPNHALRMLERLVRVFKNPRVFPFVHVPVQCGSDKVLAEMNRQYKAADFERVVAEFRRGVPGIFVATDVIVGFPTETEADFEQTLRLVERTKPDKVNISRFFPRPGTPAACLKLLPTQVLAERSHRLASLCKRINGQ